MIHRSVEIVNLNMFGLMQSRKVSEEHPSNPTEILTKASVNDSSSTQGLQL